MPEDCVPELLRLAGLRPSNEKAAAWLSKAIEGAKHSFKAAQQRPLPADHNDRLIEIEKSARSLTKQLERLRQYPIARSAFWRSQSLDLCIEIG